MGDLILEQRFRVWAYGGALPRAFVVGEPRCYVGEFAEYGATRGLVIVPDMFRRSLVDAVSRLTRGR